MNENNILVSVFCLAYNHANYLRETLEGFLMQKTNFAFEVLIHEDSSTDGTREIVKEYEERYPHLFRVIYEKENQWSKGLDYCYDLLLPKARGKYIAFCEGDDAWIDDKKLQLQFECLENNPQISLCVHKSYMQYPPRWKGFREPRAMGYPQTGYLSFSELVCGWNTATSSFFFRRAIYEKMPLFFREAPTGDDSLKYYLATKGEVYYIDRVMSVYNRCVSGSWSEGFLADKDFENKKRYTFGYLTLYQKLDEYMNYMEHDVIETCIKTKIKQLLDFIWINNLDYIQMRNCLDSIERDIHEEYKSYIDEKIISFGIFNNNIFRKKYYSKTLDKKVFIYGMGALAERVVMQLRDCQIPIAGVIISDGQPYQKEFYGYPVHYMKEYKSHYQANDLIFVSLNRKNADEVVKELNEYGITEYVCPYVEIYD